MAVEMCSADDGRRRGDVVRKLCKIPAYVCRLVRARGIRKALLHLGCELYSQDEYVVTHRDLTSRVETLPSEGQITITEVTSDQIREIEELCRVWPSEFGYWRPEYLKQKVIHDLENGNWCFCACANGDVIGGIWVLNEDAALRSCPVRHLPGERIVGRAFIVPHARGMGLSKWLYNHAVKIAAERGVPQLFAFTFPRRVASIKAKLRVDFQVVGTLTVKTRLGRNAYTFTPTTEQGHLQGSAAPVPARTGNAQKGER